MKLLLSQYHLQADARERVAMMETYIALLKGEDEKQFVSKEDISLALTSLFRPSTSGVVNDDTNPNVLLESLSKILKK